MDPIARAGLDVPRLVGDLAARPQVGHEPGGLVLGPRGEASTHERAVDRHVRPVPDGRSIVGPGGSQGVADGEEEEEGEAEAEAEAGGGELLEHFFRTSVYET